MDNVGQRRAMLLVGAVLLLVMAGATAWVLVPRTPVNTTISSVVLHRRRWEGIRVRIEGRLVEFHDAAWPTYGVVEDAQQDRIGIKDLKPWLGLVGDRVVAVGTVSFDPHFGRYLANPRLRLAGTP